MLSWLPIVGPLLQGLFDTVGTIYGKYQDTSLAKQQDTNKTDVEVIQARAQVAIAMRDDLGTKLNRDLIMFPVGAWVTLKAWELTMVNLVPSWVWHIEDWSDKLQYIPYAVIAYLFVTAWRGK